MRCLPDDITLSEAVPGDLFRFDGGTALWKVLNIRTPKGGIGVASFALGHRSIADGNRKIIIQQAHVDDPIIVTYISGQRYIGRAGQVQ